MSRYIDADKIDFNECFVGQSDFARDTREAAQNLIDKQPTADAEPVRHGHWVKDRSGQEYCSVCGQYGVWSDRVGTLWTLYCPNCGAKMDGKED